MHTRFKNIGNTHKISENVNTKLIAAISMAVALATLLVYQAFVVGFVVSNQTSGSVVQIDSQNALLQIDPIEFSAVSGNGGLSITLPPIAPGTADYAAEIDPPSGSPVSNPTPIMYSAAYLFAIAEVEFNYPGNSNAQAQLFASLENVQTNNLPITILVLATPGTTLVQKLTSFPNNEIQIQAGSTPGMVTINGQSFWVLATYGLPSNIASQIGTTSVTIGSGGSAGANIYFLVLLGSTGTLGNSGATFTAALNLYGYQS
ncbi:hypothetical protein J5U23_01510 [Saccharolobus shibatae B12]|uniref:Uncharacterized protein n=1 Tax=Saccharolobus shibatae (strain ATCC 51178 / DSM 5389 / JCM 8931 / NBRC 15437 / B12) TaxID=523848 RepID=A0A8F5BNR5_SACSH|nr:hypothetical protein [Saccharolobus shibatae]QXJ28641.1 hypothetical protein J5U23_01510 [Saccharolobus shibatae B12]